jgi:hypothetical protein
MGAESSRPEAQASQPHVHRPLSWHWPALLALLIIGAIYTLMSDQFMLGPRWLPLTLIIALVIPLTLSLRHGRFRLTRSLAFVLLGLVTLAEAASTVVLVTGLFFDPQRLNEVPHTLALTLLRDGALIWIVNILTFALWYWEIDAGGPGRRLHQGYHSADFVFPQLTLGQPPGKPWCPNFVDYLFLAFNTSTAFSPTDTLVLSRRAKLLMMVQALISLTVLAILAARAINTL